MTITERRGIIYHEVLENLTYHSLLLSRLTNDNSHPADVPTPLAVRDIGIIVNPILISSPALKRARNNVRR